MKLRNKKTGEIVEATDFNIISEYSSLSELNEDWEDYKEPKAYYIGRCGTIEEFDPTKDVALTEMLKEIGNYFETKEEAEKAVEKLKAWKRLKDKGFKFRKLRRYLLTDGGLDIRLSKSEYWEDEQVKADLDLLFGGEE